MDEEITAESMLVLADFQDEDGTLLRAITIEDDAFVLSGHDTGPAVERILGCNSYEFERRLSVTETVKMIGLLGVATAHDLLDAVAKRFDSFEELEAFLANAGIEGTFWSQLED